MVDPDTDQLALGILDGVLERVDAWDQRRCRNKAATAAVPPCDAAAAVPLPAASAAKALSYNPCIVPNCSGARLLACPGARPLAARFDHAVETMDAIEIDHDYARRLPQILSQTAIHTATAYQIRVAKQQTGCRCGHHAFHNALSAARAITAASEAEALEALADTQSEPAFWSRFNRSLASLHSEAARRGTDCWPWDYDFVDGEVERSHMTHLLRTDAAVGSLGGERTFLVFQYAMGRPMLETASLLACQQAADDFVAAPGPCHRCVIVGALSHWVAVVLNKVPLQSSSGSSGDGGGETTPAAAATALEVLLFDSNNTPVLGVSDEQLAEIAAAKAEERGWDPDSSKESYYRSSLHDMRSVVTLLARLFSGATDLRAEAVNGAVERVLQDFHATVDAAISTHLAAAAAAAAAASSGDSDGCDGDDATQPEAEAWHLWLKERQPPPVLRSGLLATVERWGKGWLSDQNRAELRVWAERAIAFSRWHESERSERVAEPAAAEVTAAETAVAKARAIAGLAEVAEAILAAL